MACAVSAVWIALAAELTVANTADTAVAPSLFQHLPPEVRYILGDTHYNTPGSASGLSGTWLVASRRGKYPPTDNGVEVRRIFHKLRSQTIQPFNGLFKNTFDWGGQVPVRSLPRTQLVVLGAVLLSQLVLLYQFHHHKPLAVGVKPLLRPA